LETVQTPGANAYGSPFGAPMNIVDATRRFETWLRSRVIVHEPDLHYKHEQMALEDDPFPFFRGTYYRWLQQWLTVCRDLDQAPRVLGVGDLHIENFGTWRDLESRLVWGINDFDEAAELPYTNDLVRLAASVRAAKQSGVIQLSFRKACVAMLRGYRKTLVEGGNAFILEEDHRPLRRLATRNERAPHYYWEKLEKILKTPTCKPPLPQDALEAFASTWPSAHLKLQYRFHEQVGMGSLGKPRFLAMGRWNGSWVAREVKALTPPANEWVTGKPFPSRIQDVLQRAVRCLDPYYQPKDKWIVRRLAARCSRLELKHLENIADQRAIFMAMGAETANIHLGTKEMVPEIRRDLDLRPKDWLVTAARQMAKVMNADWKDWRKNGFE
jgi:hypothetical protein